ncbi:unnamed protein product [Paramecium primaurelia]|uniref:Uncharacterized protein n=2 Tax=Paramecium primaurelia TaxID=5886 RepID=A0A8S1P2E6_PARPR|nr:unnamed protein product [Paramecium primaurelia]
MNTDPIYLEEKIQHSLLVVYLYVLRLPTQHSEIRQLNETISKNKIKTIFYSGTQPLQILVDQLFNVSQETSMSKIIQDIHEELIKKQSNVGLICSQQCAISLKIYFHYMVAIELKKFQDLRLNLFQPYFSIEQLQQDYNEINRNLNRIVLGEDSNLPNSFLNQSKNKSEIINLVQQRSQLKTLQITNSHRIFNGYQKEQSNQLSNRSRMILGKDDQVISELVQSDIMIPPFISLLESSIEAESSIKSIQNIQINCIQPNVKKQYKLPQSIQFVPFIPIDGFKCLQ